MNDDREQTIPTAAPRDRAERGNDVKIKVCWILKAKVNHDHVTSRIADCYFRLEKRTLFRCAIITVNMMMGGW